MKKLDFDGRRLEGKKVNKILFDLINENNYSDKVFTPEIPEKKYNHTCRHYSYKR